MKAFPVALCVSHSPSFPFVFLLQSCSSAWGLTRLVVDVEGPSDWRAAFSVHPCGPQELLIRPLPEDTFYPDGAHIKDLKEVHDLLCKVQRPALTPSVHVFLLLLLLLSSHY